MMILRDEIFQGQESKRTTSGSSREQNIYLPLPAVIEQIKRENDLVSTFVLRFKDELLHRDFDYEPGQFMMLSVPNCGEAPISFSSAAVAGKSFSLTIRKAGQLTTVVHSLQVGDVVGLRGPYGRSFPLDELKGENLLFVAGGIGMAPLRSVLQFCFARSEDYGKLTLIYGCREPDEFCFQDEMQAWQEDKKVKCLLTIDQPHTDWQGHVGLVPELLDDGVIDPASDRVLVCGPSIMIRFVIERLQASGVAGNHILTTLERHMKCGVGVCGHCHFEDKMICTDGPVFFAGELADLKGL